MVRIWSSLRLITGISVLLYNELHQVDCGVLKKEGEAQSRSFFSSSPGMFPRPGYPPPPPMMGPQSPYYGGGPAGGGILSDITSFFLGIFTQWFLSSAVDQVGQFFSSFLFSDGEIFGYTFNDLLGVFDYVDLKQNSRPGLFGSLGGPRPPPSDGGMFDYGGMGGMGGMGMPMRPPDQPGLFGGLGPVRPPPVDDFGWF